MNGFMPHGMCFLWQPDVLTLHVVSDGLIALAYFSIPLLIVTFLRRRPDVPFSPIFWMFSAFIVACGLTHVMAIVVIWHPLYWSEGALKGFTALVSVATALMLVPILPKALGLRTPAELEKVNEQLRESVDESARLLRRYEREHYIATTLQSASLGDLPARIGPLELSAVYQPGVGDLEIGGDWYDAFQLPDGRVIVSIGDVAGKGLNASVTMAKMRQAIRVASQVQLLPGAILDAADRALRLEHPDQIVTAFVGIIDQTEGLLTFANAGHPFPLLREPDGTLTELASIGLPLGLRSRDEALTADCVTLHTGALLVLFTDGLVESKRDYVVGEAQLRDVLGRQSVVMAVRPAREIHDALLADGARDDVAILAVRIGAPTDAGERWIFPVTDSDAAYAARDAMVAILRARGASHEEIFASELIFGELIGNVSRYAAGLADVRLDWQGAGPVLHVLDNGPGFQYSPQLPADVLAESGRGLFLVYQLTPDFAIIPRPGGGSHARAVLPLARPRLSVAS